MEHIKIVFFTNQLGGGGAEMHFLRVLNALDDRQFQKELWLVRPGGGYESFVQGDIKIVHLHNDENQSSTLGLVRSRRKLTQMLDEKKPAILYSILNLPNLIAIKAARKAKHPVKTVISVQNTLRPPNKKGWVHRLTLRWAKKWFPKADQIIAISQGVEKDLQNLLGGGIPATTIYNAGWDERMLENLSERSAVIRQTYPETFLMVCCGRLTRQKGYPYLLEALSHLEIHQNWKLLIVGAGQEREALQSLAEELGVANKIEFLGFQKDPFQFMAAADLFVLPSLWEGFGNVVVEAMKCGSPILATDCFHGPGEIIAHQKNGWLVPVKDAAALREAIEKLSQDEPLRKSLAKAGEHRANDFGSAAIAKNYAREFLKLNLPKP